jgi:hypothetical protein
LLTLTVMTGVILGAVAYAQDGTKSETIATDAIQPQVAIGNGLIAVAYISKGDVHVATSADGGKAFKSGIAMQHGQVRGGKRRGPRVAIDDDGGIHVTAPMPGNSQPNKRGMRKNELFYSVSRDGGKTWADPLRVNTPDESAAEGLHWMAVSEAGVVHIAWMDMRIENSIQLFYTTIEDGKKGEERSVFAEPCPCCAPGLTVDAKGNPILVVRDAAQTDRAIQLLRSTNGGKTFSRPKPMNGKPSNVDG